MKLKIQFERDIEKLQAKEKQVQMANFKTDFYSFKKGLISRAKSSDNLIADFLSR